SHTIGTAAVEPGDADALRLQPVRQLPEGARAAPTARARVRPRAGRHLRRRVANGRVPRAESRRPYPGARTLGWRRDRRVERDSPVPVRGHVVPARRPDRPGTRPPVAVLRAEPARAERRHGPVLAADGTRPAATGRVRPAPRGRAGCAANPRRPP